MWQGLGSAKGSCNGFRMVHETWDGFVREGRRSKGEVRKRGAVYGAGSWSLLSAAAIY